MGAGCCRAGLLTSQSGAFDKKVDRLAGMRTCALPVPWGPSMQAMTAPCLLLSYYACHYGACLPPAAADVRHKLMPLLLEWDMRQQGQGGTCIGGVSSQHAQGCLPALSPEARCVASAGRRCVPSSWDTKLRWRQVRRASHLVSFGFLAATSHRRPELWSLLLCRCRRCMG